MMRAERNNMDYFENIANVERLRNELKSWIGTAFRYSTQGRAEPKITADCVSFPIGVFKRLSLIPADYSPAFYCSHNVENQLERIYADLDTMQTRRADSEPIIAGDVLVCSFKRGIQHLLIASGDGLAWDCWPGVGVRSVPLCAKRIKDNLRRIYRWQTATI